MSTKQEQLKQDLQTELNKMQSQAIDMDSLMEQIKTNTTWHQLTNKAFSPEYFQPIGKDGQPIPPRPFRVLTMDEIKQGYESKK